jgi:hypothetical protein
MMMLIVGAQSRFWLAPVSLFGLMSVATLRRLPKHEGSSRQTGDFQMERNWTNGLGAKRLNEGSAADAGFSQSVFRDQRPGPADFVR